MPELPAWAWSDPVLREAAASRQFSSPVLGAAVVALVVRLARGGASGRDLLKPT